MKTKIKNGFTLIELLIIVAIIGILASIILVAWGVSAKDKAAISGYKTSMDSVRTAAEMCTGAGGGGTVQSGNPNGAVDRAVCDPDNGSKYPAMPSRCGPSPYFYVQNPAGDNWRVTTGNAGGTSWNCKGCRLICTVTECVEATGTNCD